MLFKKKEKTSFIREDELSDDSLGSKGSLFSKIFKKKDKVEETEVDNNTSNDMINNTNSSSDMISSSLDDMYDSGGSDSNLVDINQNVDVKPTDTDKKYYFNIYDSTERFGRKYKSPFLKNKIKGYIEIDDNGKSADYYIYVNDGLFGISGVKLEDIDAKDVGIFTDLTLEHPKAMECKLKFELRE